MDSPGGVLAIPFASEHNDSLPGSGSETIERLVPDPNLFLYYNSSHIPMKLEAEFDAHVAGSDFDQRPKDEFAIESNWFGDFGTSVDEVAAWQPEDLMEAILADTAESGLGVRLDDDIYIEANKESSLAIFGVLTL